MSNFQGDFAPFRRLLQDVKVRSAVPHEICDFVGTPAESIARSPAVPAKVLDVLTPAVLYSTACPPTPFFKGGHPLRALERRARLASLFGLDGTRRCAWIAHRTHATPGAPGEAPAAAVRPPVKKPRCR